jgi:pimeloyl-ACP methyl ester carboxylesterase
VAPSAGEPTVKLPIPGDANVEIPLWFPNSQGTMLSTLLIAPDGWLDVPVVILCRGDNSPLADGQDLQIGHALADRGIASVLLDFSAASFPSGPLDQAALTRPIEDLGSTLDVLRLQRDVNVGQIGVSGSRLAGTVALLRAAIDPRIRTLVLRAALAPANQLPIEPLKIPTLLLVGNQDQSVLADTKKLEQWLTGRSELCLIPNAGPHFAEPGVFDAVQHAIVNWFVRLLGSGVRRYRTGT